METLALPAAPVRSRWRGIMAAVLVGVRVEEGRALPGYTPRTGGTGP